VHGVARGHVTVVVGDAVTCGPADRILPHDGNLSARKVRAPCHRNAFGKIAGSTQVNELGEIETPIMLTST